MDRHARNPASAQRVKSDLEVIRQLVLRERDKCIQEAISEMDDFGRSLIKSTLCDAESRARSAAIWKLF